MKQALPFLSLTLILALNYQKSRKKISLKEVPYLRVYTLTHSGITALALLVSPQLYSPARLKPARPFFRGNANKTKTKDCALVTLPTNLHLR